jgi:hypothetical protein
MRSADSRGRDEFVTWRFVSMGDDHFLVNVVVESQGPIGASPEGTVRPMPPRVRPVYTCWRTESLKSRLVHSLENADSL